MQMCKLRPGGRMINIRDVQKPDVSFFFSAKAICKMLI